VRARNHFQTVEFSPLQQRAWRIKGQNLSASLAVRASSSTIKKSILVAADVRRLTFPEGGRDESLVTSNLRSAATEDRSLLRMLDLTGPGRPLAAKSG
jgi:hypothetical protein